MRPPMPGKAAVTSGGGARGSSGMAGAASGAELMVATREIASGRDHEADGSPNGSGRGVLLVYATSAAPDKGPFRAADRPRAVATRAGVDSRTCRGASA